MISARYRRPLGLLAAAAMAVTLLSACQPRVGAAAYVGSTRISESTVGLYVSRTATVRTDPNSGQVDSPKSDALTSLVLTALIDQVFIQTKGGLPPAAVMDSARAAALQQNGVTDLAGLEKLAEPVGFTKAYAPVYLDEAAKIALIETSLQDTDGSKLIKAIADLHIKVSVSPRYGDWQPNQLTVSSGPSVPSFLHLGATDPATANGTSG